MVFSLSTPALAAPPESPYDAGETLSPSCSPGDTSCTVDPPQESNAYLADIAGIIGTQGDIMYFNGTDWVDLVPGTSGQYLQTQGTGANPQWASSGAGDMLSANNLSDLANASTARTNLGLVIGTDVQAYDAQLADIAGLAVTGGNFIVGDGTNWIVESGTTARTSLGLGNVENTALSTWAGSTNITTLGTIGAGTWQGTAIGDTYISSAAIWNAKVGSTRTITAGIGLSGGGDLSADRTIDLDIDSLTAESVINDADTLAIYDASGTSIKKITRANFLSGVTGALVYQGTWNANTNTPTLANGTGTQGQYHVVSTAGSQDLGSGSIAFTVGDWAIHNGSVWEKLDSTNDVQSVFGRIGIVTASSGDYTGSQITNTATGNIAATDVQAAINELDTEKQAAHAYLTDITGITVNQGDIIYFNGTDWVDLAPGTSGQVLQTGGAAANPSWTTISGTVTDGTSANNTLRWNGTGWVESAILTNDGTDITTTGDLAVNGGDITSTGTLTITPNAGNNLSIALSTTGNFAVNTDDLVVDTSAGNVGIGDTSPDDLLNIHSASAAAGLAVTSLGTDTDAYLGFQLADGTNLFTLGVDDSDSDKFKISTTGLGTNDRLVIDASGNVGIGATTINASAKLQIDSTTQGFLPPRMTEAQMDAISSPATGLTVFNTTHNILFYHNGTRWVSVEQKGISSNNPLSAHTDYVPSGVNWNWVQTNAMTSPMFLAVREWNNELYVAIGRGRTWGTSWNNSGVNTGTMQTEHDLTATAAFTYAHLSQTQVQQLANNQTPNNWGVDGMILQRAAVTALTGTESDDWQFYEITAAETSAFSWDFATANTFDITSTSWSTSSIGTSGTSGTGDIIDYQPGNDHRRIFTWNWGSHGVVGFSYGSAVTNGSNSATSYLWENANENHSMPHTIVWMKLGF